MRKIFLCTLLTFAASMTILPVIAQKGKESKKSSKKKIKDEEVEMPPPPQEVLEYKIGAIDSSYTDTTKSRTGFTNEDFFFNNADTMPPPEDELTAELRKLLNITGALNLGAQLAKTMHSHEERDNVLPPEFYDRILTEMSTGDGKRIFENLMIRIYRNHLNLDDVKNMNVFYSSETGQKMLKTTPMILSECYEKGKGVGSLIGMRVYNQLLKEGKIK
jgi:Uncharacterized protein conserved in bacteria (DUF2059)